MNETTPGTRRHRGAGTSPTRWLLLPLLAILGLPACAARFPTPPAAPVAGPSAAALLQRSIEAAGGDPYETLDDVAVRYEGSSWGSMVQILQPLLTDVDYRGLSEERILLSDSVVAQKHRAGAGEKTVFWDGEEVRVFYGSTAANDLPVRESSALVADAYALFLLGPAWLQRRGSDWTRLDDRTEDGRVYHRLHGRLRPGVGLSTEDRVVAWIDQDTGLLHRVHFTLEGFEATRGAHVDVTFSAYRQIAGRLWPTHFVERVRSPVDIYAHLWLLEGLDVNRGLRPADLGSTTDPTWSAVATRPAAPLSDATHPAP